MRFVVTLWVHVPSSAVTVLRGARSSNRIDIMPFELFGQMPVSTEEEWLEGIAQMLEALWQSGVFLSWPMYFEIAEVP